MLETEPDFSTLTPLLAAEVELLWQRFTQSVQNLPVPPIQDPRVLTALPRVWMASRYVAQRCIRDPSSFLELIQGGDLYSAERRGDYLPQLRERTEAAGNLEELQGILRRFRHREMVRIAWRDICGWDSIEDVLCDLSLLAEACVKVALEWLFQRACQRYGVPRGADGSPQLPVVIGMGKLGGWELNFSSDIDLIFAFERDGELDDARRTSYQEFYLRLCRDLVKALHSQTDEGFVFRVDTRLRPFGDAGPLVLSFDAMEIYYQSQARAWERYAMIKARPIAGDPGAGERLLKILQPFVYRRYLDYRALGALRELKQKIMEELKRRDRLEDIKLGPGGIREVEFIAQVFQLIHGGRQPRLQERRLLPVLARLGEFAMLPTEEVNELIVAYRFLRRVENRLQQVDDGQTQRLPTSEEERLRLALALGYPDWESFAAALAQVREKVQATFERVFANSQTSPKESPAGKIWRMAQESEVLCGYLADLGYIQTDEVLGHLSAFKNARSIRYLTPAAEAELDRLMPCLIESAGKTGNPDTALQRMLTLLESIASRSAYLTLLA